MTGRQYARTGRRVGMSAARLESNKAWIRERADSLPFMALLPLEPRPDRIDRDEELPIVAAPLRRCRVYMFARKSEREELIETYGGTAVTLADIEVMK